MSCQRGNVKRTRPQKYKNKTSFKNDLHDTSQKTKQLNTIEIVNVCAKCKGILEWKIKYKKYKVLRAPKKCTKCEQKTVKNAYHIMCIPCADEHKVCPKCGKSEEIVKRSTPDQFKLDEEFQKLIKSLPERKRRTFLRYISQKEKKTDGEDSKQSEKTKEEAMAKLQALRLGGEEDDDFDDFDFSDDEDEEDDDDDEDSGGDDDGDDACSGE
ncbi:uncharacterized protein C9orf85 homolog [Periplaneta americana]|uniref:uncharacterized protein C9orf85 homolog n=1 Tax=Periplaneta americana TaxID=6978 RepID=UPI0037E8FB5E